MALLVADLHLHSDASDGELPPEAVVDLAAETGLRAIALTDHDTVAGLPRALERARLRGVEVIPGCELTAYEGSVELHLLAYGFEFEDEASPLGRLLSAQREARHARAFEIAARLRGHGVAVPDEAVLAAAGPAAALGRPHVARALVAGGHARDMQDAFQRYLGRHAPGHVEKPRVAPKTVIDAVHASGGIVALAHPSPHDELIAPLFRLGLDAVEAFHANTGEANRRFYAGLARRYDKGVTGGSDFHGPRANPARSVGCDGIGAPALADLRRRMEARKQHPIGKG